MPRFAPCHTAHEPAAHSFGQRGGVEHQAEGGGKAELEADIPQRGRAVEGHYHPREKERPNRPIGTAEPTVGNDVHPAHNGRPHHRSLCPDQDGIEGDASRGKHGRTLRA